jgi:ABC-2 type transport system permease protein
MKLVWKDLITMLVLFISIVLFGLMIGTLAVSAQDLSSLPIGIVDKDQSGSSRELVSGLQKSETLRIVEDSEKALQKLLLDEMITSIFVIEKGYEADLKAGRLKDIITMYYKEENKSASILADIVAGEIIYPASLYKSYGYYEQLPYEGQKRTLKQYEEYMDRLVGSSPDFDFAFHIIYLNPEKAGIPNERLSNTVLYNQFIFGLLGIMMAFIAMFILSQTVNEKENKVEVRLKASGFHILTRDLGNISALTAWEGLLSVILTGLIASRIRTADIKLWLSAFSLLLLNAVAIGMAMLLAAKLIRRIPVYQVFCSAFILLTGGLGFYHLLSGFYQGFIDHVVKFIPNSWFIQGFTDIIIYGGRGGYIKEGHRMLMVMDIALIFLVAGVDLVREMRFIRIGNKNRMVG